MLFQRVCGVSIHPRYGGWFAIRGAIIFKSVTSPDLQQKQPLDVVPEQDKKVELLKLFNYHWQDWRFRDIIEPMQRYSDDQKLYFDTLPKDRKPLIRELRQKYLLQSSGVSDCSSASSHPS